MFKLKRRALWLEALWKLIVDLASSKKVVVKSTISSYTEVEC